MKHFSEIRRKRNKLLNNISSFLVHMNVTIIFNKMTFDKKNFCQHNRHLNTKNICFFLEFKVMDNFKL